MSSKKIRKRREHNFEYVKNVNVSLSARSPNKYLFTGDKKCKICGTTTISGVGACFDCGVIFK